MVTAPLIEIELFHDLCAEWIEVDVFEQDQQIVVPVAQNGLVPPLKEVPHSPVFPIEIGRVCLVDALKDFGERNVLGLDKEMDVVPHKNITIQKALVAIFVYG